MREPRILADEHIPRSVVKRLVSYGVDVETLEDMELRSSPDSKVIDEAVEDDRAVLTMDDDFVDIARNSSTCGVLYFTKRVSKKKMASEIMKALNSLSQEEIENEIIYLPRSRE